MENTLDQLKRILDYLEDLRGVFKPFGFGLLRPSEAARVPLAVWKKAMDEGDNPIHQIEFTNRSMKPSCWLDPSPDQTYCIRWWGARDGIKEYKKWGKLLYGHFQLFPDSAPNLFVPFIWPDLTSGVFLSDLKYEPPTGYFWTINALMGHAHKNLQISDCCEHPLLECKYPEVRVIPTRLRDTISDRKIQIIFYEMDADAITVGLRVMKLLIEGKLPALNVERDVIYLNGVPVDTDPHNAKFIAILLAANGGWVSPDEIRKQLWMSEDERIDRAVIKKLPKAVRDLVERKAGKGSRIVQG